MKIKDLIPWGRGKHEIQPRTDGQDPLDALQSNVSRAFEDFWHALEWPMPGASGTGRAGGTLPRVDVRESAKEVEVMAELPGMNEADIEVGVAKGTLTIRGEKESERKAEDKGYVLRERSFGRIERVVPLPDGLDLDSASATFKNGVLTVTIPKTAEAQAAVKRVAVHHA